MTKKYILIGTSCKQIAWHIHVQQYEENPKYLKSKTKHINIQKIYVEIGTEIFMNHKI